MDAVCISITAFDLRMDAVCIYTCMPIFKNESKDTRCNKADKIAAV